MCVERVQVLFVLFFVFLFLISQLTKTRKSIAIETKHEIFLMKIGVFIRISDCACAVTLTYHTVRDFKKS